MIRVEEGANVLNESWNLTSLQSLHTAAGHSKKCCMTLPGHIELLRDIYTNTFPLIFNSYLKLDLDIFNQESRDKAQMN